MRVPSAQPLGLLAAAMLEPESPDSLLAWNFFPEILQRTEYIEGYAIAPLADRMLAADPKLRAEFEAKLKADPKFAADPQRAPRLVLRAHAILRRALPALSGRPRAEALDQIRAG